MLLTISAAAVGGLVSLNYQLWRCPERVHLQVCRLSALHGVVDVGVRSSAISTVPCYSMRDRKQNRHLLAPLGAQCTATLSPVGMLGVVLSLG